MAGWFLDVLALAGGAHRVGAGALLDFDAVCFEIVKLRGGVAGWGGKFSKQTSQWETLNPKPP